MLGVAKKIIYFLFIILVIILSFAHAFLILLRPKLKFSENELGNLSDGNVTNEEPNENTNSFTTYPNSLLATYLFLTGNSIIIYFIYFNLILMIHFIILIGDRTFLAAWPPNDNPIMMILMIMFSFVIVVYLMNLFIGLLNIAINADNDRAFYLAQKAEVSDNYTNLNHFILNLTKIFCL